MAKKSKKKFWQKNPVKKISTPIQQNFEPIISIITTMYNDEQYIQEMLNSILMQNFSNFEWIIIDDQSTDNSLEIVKKFAEHFPKDQIRIVKNSIHSGSKADLRNFCMKQARGKYLTFVEPSDWLAPNFLHDFYKIAEDNNVDLVRPRKYLLSDGKRSKDGNLITLMKNDECYEPVQKVEYLQASFAEKIFLLTSHKLNQSLYGTLFRRELIEKNQFRFLRLTIGSELFFSLQMFFVATKYFCVDDASYIHRNMKPTLSLSQMIQATSDGIVLIKDFLNRIQYFRENQNDFNEVVAYFFKMQFDEIRKYQLQVGIDSPEYKAELDRLFRPIFGEDTIFVTRLFRFAGRKIVPATISKKVGEYKTRLMIAE